MNMNEPTFAVNDWVASKADGTAWGRVLRISPRLRASVLVAIKGDVEDRRAFRPDEVVKTMIPHTHTKGGMVG